MKDLTKEIIRLGIADPTDGSKFVFCIDFGYYESEYAIDICKGPLWACVDIDGYRAPVCLDDVSGKWYEAADQSVYVNNRRYPNKRYITLTSRHGRKLCRYGCLWIFDKDVIGKTIYLTFGVGYRFMDADWIAVPVVPTVFDERDAIHYDKDSNIRLMGAKMRLQVMPDKTFTQQLTIRNSRPSYKTDIGWRGAWSLYDYKLVKTDTVDSRSNTEFVSSELITMDETCSGKRFRRVSKPIPIEASNIEKMLVSI